MRNRKYDYDRVLILLYEGKKMVDVAEETGTPYHAVHYIKRTNREWKPIPVPMIMEETNEYQPFTTKEMVSTVGIALIIFLVVFAIFYLTYN